MRRRSQQPEVLFMDTEAIGDFALPVEGKGEHEDSFVSAAVFSTGETRRLQYRTDVYGLIVVAGFTGYHFGDDGTSTALLASELPLDGKGLTKVERLLTPEIDKTRRGYVAEYLGQVSVEEAAEKYLVEQKIRAGVPYPRHISWPNGSATY